uniref:Piwi domain-containing protein n=1 Tax=Panagrolaimus superbus TaxID=310955 RepID=A0A914YB47_9BILA
MNGEQEKKMIANAQRLPLELLQEIKLQKQQASIHDHDSYIKSAGVRVSEEMNSVNAEVLNAPLIIYKNENMPKQVCDAVWDIKDVEFVKPAIINALLIIYNGVPHGVLLLPVKKILDQARRLGMTIRNHDFLALRNDQLTFEFLEKTITQYRDSYGVDFVLAIGTGSDFHNILKATEVSTKIATQQVEPGTIKNPKLGGVTIGNILQKMNPKNGGYNQYFQQAVPSQINSDRIDVFQSFLQTTMVMGFYMSHPSPGSNEEQPSVCGYSFSINKRGNVARGGFVFTKPRQSILSEVELRKPFEDATKLYYQENNSYPQRVLVYRFGTSDGEISKIQGDECPQMLECLAAGMNGQIPQLTVIAVRRQHNTRIFKQKNSINPRDRAPAQNVTPGSCVAGANPFDVVMVPHRALQGTAKPTIFSTIFPGPEENDLTQNFLKNITHAFCYMHEIVNSPISVPHTLRSAEQMANRGTKLWHSKSHEFPPLAPEELYAHATNALNPLIETRYWA